MDLLSGDDNYSAAALPAPPAPPAAPAAVVIASPERVAASPHASKAAPSAAAASSNAPASRIAVSFTVRGLVELLPSSQGLFDKQTRSGAGGGWGGLKKAMNQVVIGERQGSLQISLESQDAVLFSSELVADSEDLEAVHFSRVATLSNNTSIPSTGCLRLLLWQSSKRDVPLVSSTTSTSPTPSQNSAASALMRDGSSTSSNKRLPIGEVSLTLGELSSLKGPTPYMRRLHSDKYPTAEVLIWCLPPINMHGISMSPSGMANVMNTHKFNPMIEYFTYVKDPASVVTSSTSNGSNDGGSFKDHVLLIAFPYFDTCAVAVYV
eukprot:2962-Heterococcus_DN1.PRE.1